MNAKEYLSQIEMLEVRITNREEEIQKLKSYSENVSNSIKMRGNRNYKQEGNFENPIMKIRDLEEINRRDILELSEKRKEVIQTIELLNNPKYERILYLRYCQKKTWEEIAIETGNTYQWVNELCKRALKKLEKIINTY